MPSQDYRFTNGSLSWGGHHSSSDANGRMIRTLDLGYRPTGNYVDKAHAAYWDGRNATGERVGSGVYFYQLQAGDFSATRRMIIVK